MCRRLKPKPPTTQPWRSLQHSQPDLNQPASEESGTVHTPLLGDAGCPYALRHPGHTPPRHKGNPLDEWAFLHRSSVSDIPRLAALNLVICRPVSVLPGFLQADADCPVKTAVLAVDLAGGVGFPLASLKGLEILPLPFGAPPTVMLPALASLRAGNSG